MMRYLLYTINGGFARGNLDMSENRGALMVLASNFYLKAVKNGLTGLQND
jgi:hypothetical protein